MGVVILYIRYAKNITRKLEMINNFHKEAEYNVNLQKSKCFHTCKPSIQAHKVVINTSLFTIASKYLGLNLPKEVKDINNIMLNCLGKRMS